MASFAFDNNGIYILNISKSDENQQALQYRSILLITMNNVGSHTLLNLVELQAQNFLKRSYIIVTCR